MKNSSAERNNSWEMETIFCFCICEHGGVFKFVFLILSLSEIATPIPGIGSGSSVKITDCPATGPLRLSRNLAKAKYPQNTVLNNCLNFFSTHTMSQMQNMKYVKVPYPQIRSAWKWYCWVGLENYKTKFKKKYNSVYHPRFLFPWRLIKLYHFQANLIWWYGT